jgi:hypothetical protein
VDLERAAGRARERAVPAAEVDRVPEAARVLAVVAAWGPADLAPAVGPAREAAVLEAEQVPAVALALVAAEALEPAREVAAMAECLENG